MDWQREHVNWTYDEMEEAQNKFWYVLNYELLMLMQAYCVALHVVCFWSVDLFLSSLKNSFRNLFL